MKSLPWLLVLLLSVSAYIACQKEYRPGFSLDPGNPPAETVKTGISGRVVNEKNEPVEGALVTAGNRNATTDYNGYFNIENATVASDAAYIKVDMLGYFPGSRTITARENGSHYIEVELIPVKKSGEFESASGGTVAFPSGGSAIFPASAIVRESNGSAYTGKVIVSQFFIDPSVPGFTDRMPGDLKGITTSNEIRALQSFAMMAIRLNGEGGEQLQVAPGKKVDLRFPIPASLSVIAPASIPLWYFDEEKGLWKEEGSAVKSGNEYIGQVSHFSFWNCDVPCNFTEISFTVKDEAGNPQGNVRVEIKKKSDNTLASGFTDAEGRIRGWVPSGEALELGIYNACKTVIHKRDLGPYSSPADLGVVTVDPGTATAFALTVSVVNCSGQPLTNGYLNIFFGGRNIRVSLEDAQPVTVAFSHCSSQADSTRITVYDADQDKYIVQSTWLAPGPNDAGTITACEGTMGEFLKFNIDGVKHDFLSGIDSVRMTEVGGNHVIYAYRAAGIPSGQIIFAPGTNQPYTTPLLGFSLSGDSSLNLFSNSNGNVNIVKYGAINEYVEGTFNSQVTDSISGRTNLPMTGSFRVKRLF